MLTNLIELLLVAFNFDTELTFSPFLLWIDVEFLSYLHRSMNSHNFDIAKKRKSPS